MNREDFKLMAYGHHVYTNRERTLKIEEIELFVDGAVFAFDKLKKEMNTERFNRIQLALKQSFERGNNEKIGI